MLLATYNGCRWLPEQVASILEQTGVDVDLWVSDDGSTDGTWEWLERAAACDPRISLLPRAGNSGAPARNFYRLVRLAGWQSADFVAFADQDDIWLPDKLCSHAALLHVGACDGVSSNVIAFWPDGRRLVINKAQPQREMDFLFEGPGPGCTALITPWLASELKRLLEDEATPAGDVSYHDWLAYAVCRAAGRRWILSRVPSVLYRQHVTNALGANVGTRQALTRFRYIANHWHRYECAKIGSVALHVATATERTRLTPVIEAIRSEGGVSRFTLLRHAHGFRRRLRDRLTLTALIVAGVW